MARTSLLSARELQSSRHLLNASASSTAKAVSTATARTTSAHGPAKTRSYDDCRVQRLEEARTIRPQGREGHLDSCPHGLHGVIRSTHTDLLWREPGFLDK